MRRTHLTMALAPLALLAVAACTSPDDTSKGREWGRTRLVIDDTGGKLRGCTENFAAIDAAIDRAGTRDAQAAPIPGFPHLRTTRFLAALGPRFLKSGIGDKDNEAFEFWNGWLASTAIKARSYELANLPNPARAELRSRLGKSPEAIIDDCTAAFGGFDEQREETREILDSTVGVPDHYIDALRVIGLYSLTSIPVKFGFEQWKELNLPSFARPPSDLKIQGTVVRFAPAAEDAPMGPRMVADLLRRQADNPLNIPRPTDAQLHRLAAAFAPVYSIDVTGDHDRIGTPILVPGGAPGIDTGIPRAYVQPSWALWDGVPVLQISYLVWFSERPPTGDMDILAGRLDGVIWRVTIGRNGRPVLYDSIHPCGCYRLFFPVPPTRLKDHPIDEPGEGTVVPTHAPVLGPGKRMVLHIGSGDHYLRNLSVANTDAVSPTRYELAPMDDLRSLSSPAGGTRSLYDQHGIVAGTERGERFLLWPMGISSPGAMRQWGTHATAFVGRRHFDDPYLIDKAFTR